jgi:hypothetical protein
MRPFPERLSHLLVGGEFSAIRFCDRLPSFRDLPFIQSNVIAYRFRDKEGTAALGGVRQFIELFGQLWV